MFITRQLKGLEDTKSAQFNRYFYLLEVCEFESLFLNLNPLESLIQSHWVCLSTLSTSIYSHK